MDIENLEDSLEGTIENALSSDFMNCLLDCWSRLAVASRVGLQSFSRWKWSQESKNYPLTVEPPEEEGSWIEPDPERDFDGSAIYSRSKPSVIVG